ncbi:MULTISPECIES: hypothetical protein [Streptomyces]|uniref:Secreted protein n=1 Tax=Streptomyces solicathayae TaxID=3081768 RepID=A0ABZ0LNC9_9ACTN|nr:hypothetical protein [Streptomyces sp. HUAS YS2]WOX21011.1 hypothetical protein R2D22_06260 [Streptomyces sp. HUAS YS2]
MRRILTTFAASTLAAGTVLLGTDALNAPATVSSERFAPVGGEMTCDIPAMRADISRERDRAAQLDRLGENDAAGRARARADATERLMNACIAAERDLSGPGWR